MTSRVTRRQAIAGGAAGIAALSMNGAGEHPAGRSLQDEKAAKPSAAPYSPRDFSGLLGMPGFSKTLLENHFALYQGYVKNTNSAITALEEQAKASGTTAQALAELRRRFGWEFNGMRLHELYFENLGGKDPPAKDGKIAQAIAASFGSMEAWEKDFRTVGGMRGIGWVALARDLWGNRMFNVWIDEHDQGLLATCPIIVIMDVFEHAFMIDYGLKKGEYIEAFMKNINWPNVEKRL